MTNFKHLSALITDGGQHL